MLSLAVFIALCKAEVNDVDAVSRGLGTANQKVVGLDVTMNDSLLMHFFDSLNQLDSNY